MTKSWSVLRTSASQSSQKWRARTTLRSQDFGRYEEYVHTQLGNIPIELVQNNQNLVSHAKEYSNRMIPKLTGMVEEVREAFEDRARRLGIVYGASAEKLFRAQLEERTKVEVREWALSRLESAGKVAVKCSEKYVATRSTWFVAHLEACTRFSRAK